MLGAEKNANMETTFAALCDRLEELIAGGARLTVVAAVCETGADPQSVRDAFQHLEARGLATLAGGTNRGWSLLRRRDGSDARRRS